MLTWVEISKSAIEHNLKNFRKLAGNAALLMPVVKSNAYGHGITEIARICEESDEVDRLTVANLDEALLLRLINIKKPILILSFYEFDIQKISEAIKKGIYFAVYSIKQIEFLNSVGERIGIKCKIHIKIDTGTSRVGFRIDEIESVAKLIHDFKKIDVEGLWSHFSSSESNNKVTIDQNNILEHADNIFIKNNVNIPIKHIACTAATILHPFSRKDAVRVGIGIYGLHPSIKTYPKIDLRPVLSWKTTIIQVKNLKKGDKISYGGTYKMPLSGKIAVLPIGYFDGYNRAWSNKSKVIINGVTCPVRGRVCMNLTMVDVTKVKNCKVGDVAILLGKHGKSEISADNLADLTPDTINYEIVTRINPLLPRIVV
jgi:alanine racemase